MTKSSALASQVGPGSGGCSVSPFGNRVTVWRRSRRMGAVLAPILITTALSALFGLLVTRGAELWVLAAARGVSQGEGGSPELLLTDRADERRGRAEAVRSRNLFCHLCGEGAALGLRTQPGAPVHLAAASLPQAYLVATLRSPFTETSAACPEGLTPSLGVGVEGAILRVAKEGGTRFISPGSRLGGAFVTAILGDRVCYRHGHHLGEWRWDGRRSGSTTEDAVQGNARHDTITTPLRRVVSRRWLAETLANLGAVLGTAGGRPELRDSKMIGIRLLSLPQAAGFVELGLRPGDVITAVNGRALTDVDALLGLLAALPGAHHVSIAIERQGQPETLSVEIR